MKTTLFTGILVAAFLSLGHQAAAYQNVSSTPDGGCLQCHSFAGGTGAQHMVHTDASIACSSCHTGGTPGQNVLSSTCSQCHPVGNPGGCRIVAAVDGHPTTGASSCLECHATCAQQVPGTCQDWLGTWQFTYSSQVGATVCFDNTSIDIDNQLITLCEDDSEPNCVCIDNVTEQQLCFNTMTFQQCDNESAPDCQCFNNPLYRELSVAPGSYEVIISSAQENVTQNQIEFLCYATGTRTIDNTQVIIAQPSPAALDLLTPGLRDIIDNGTYLVYEGALDNITLTFARIAEDNFSASGFTASDTYNFLGLVSGQKQDDNITTECDLMIFPRVFSRLRTFFLSPLQVYVIMADRMSATEFARPIQIDWGTNAINDIARVQLGPRVIFGFIIVRPFQLQAGDYDVTVTYGDNGTACGPIEIR